MKNIVYNKEFDLNIVQQGKYECAAACIAQILEKPIFEIKRKMGKFGWRNDNRGASDKVIRTVFNDYGKDAIFVGKNVSVALYKERKLPDSILTVKSLNYKGSYHAVSYLKKYDVFVDPNYMLPERDYWELDSDFLTIDPEYCQIIVDRVLTTQDFLAINFMRHAKNYEFIDFLEEMELIENTRAGEKWKI